MFRSTLYSLLLLPALLLHTTNASIGLDSISTIQDPKYYVVHNGNEAAGDPVKLVQRTFEDGDGYNAPPGNNLVVYRNTSIDVPSNAVISEPNGNLFIGANSDNTALIWVSKPFHWLFYSFTSGSSPVFYNNGAICWHHATDATTVDLRKCPNGGQQDTTEYEWDWE